MGAPAALLFGLPFIGMGGFIIAICAGLIPSMTRSMHAPAPVIGAVGAAFAWAGCLVSWQGVKSLFRKLRGRGLSETRPSEPWLWDYAWHPSHSSSHKLATAMKSFAAFIFFMIFLAPFNWIGFLNGSISPPFAIAASVFDLIALVILYGAFHSILERMKYGNVAVTYGELPLRLGSPAAIGVEGLKPGSADDQITLTLRFIEERYETRGTGDDRRTEIVCYPLYSEARTMSRESLRTGLDWQLPANQEWATALSERPARFWDLELKITSRGVDYDEHFLLPIY